MEQIKRYQVRGLPAEVNRVSFSGRVVDYWAPEGGSDHILIAHDGQNIFDRRTATFLFTWRLAQTARRISRDFGAKPPVVIGIFHSSTKADPEGRAKDLCPEDPFYEGIEPLAPPQISINQLQGNSYLDQIFTEILPKITSQIKVDVGPEKVAMIGSSMGALATLYAFTKHHERFHTALALSPHWILAGDPLVDWIIPRLPNRPELKVWMSRGTRGLDSSYLPYQERADKMMKQLNWGSRYRTTVFQGNSHNERSWSLQADKALKFWLEI